MLPDDGWFDVYVVLRQHGRADVVAVDESEWLPDGKPFIVPHCDYERAHPGEYSNCRANEIPDYRPNDE